MKPACFLGVDPGVSGALAFYYTEAPSRVAAEDMPVADGDVDAVTLAKRIAIMSPDIAIVEHVHAMPGQGVSSTFKFGRAFGTAIGVLGALKVPTVFVAPARWKKHFRLSSDKERSRELAIRLFPACAESFARKRDHGRAEAALLARWGAETGGAS